MNAERLRDLARECEVQAAHEGEMLPAGLMVPGPLVHAISQAMFLAQAHILRAVAAALEEAA